MWQIEKAKLELRFADEPAVESSGGAEGIHFPEPLIVLAKRKFFIVWFVGIAAVLAVIISFFFGNTSNANHKIIPPPANQSMSTNAIVSQTRPLASPGR